MQSFSVLRRVSKFMKKIIAILSLFLMMSLLSCAQKQITEDGKVKTKRVEPNAEARARANADKDPILVFGKDKKANAFENTNIMWKATMKSLDFMPLASVDYAGGIIITDWYYKNNSDDQIKITIRFLSNEVELNSIEVKSFKKICKSERCSVSLLDNAFNNDVKNKIFSKVRELNIKEQSAKK